MQRLIAFTFSFISLTLVLYFLIAAQSVLIPFFIALIISYFIIALGEGIRKIHVNGKQIPGILSFLISILLIVGALFMIGTMLSNNVSVLIQTAPKYQERFEGMLNWFYNRVDRPVPDVKRFFESYDFTSLLTQVVFVLTAIAQSAVLIAIYVLFILTEYHFFDKKIIALFRTEKGKESAKIILKKIAEQIQSYLRIKTLMSLLTAFCSYIIMAVVGLDFAEFWALLIFFLNYIPTIGAIIATFFPCLLTFLQFGTIWPFVIVTTALVSLQFYIGNVLEPRILGRHFNLSGLVIVLALTLSGHVWGIMGMLLCVPFLMIFSIILSNFPQTKPIIILLSQTGKVEN